MSRQKKKNSYKFVVKEKVQVAVMGSLGMDGKINIEEEEEKIEDSVIHFSINDKNITVRIAVFYEEWMVDWEGGNENHPTLATPPQEGDEFILTYEDTGERVPLESQK